MPTATWDDVGGLRPVKRALRELIELPLRRPELLAKFGMPAAKGALLYGPPGEHCMGTDGSANSALSTLRGCSTSGPHGA